MKVYMLQEGDTFEITKAKLGSKTGHIQALSASAASGDVTSTITVRSLARLAVRDFTKKLCKVPEPTASCPSTLLVPRITEQSINRTNSTSH